MKIEENSFKKYRAFLLVLFGGLLTICLCLAVCLQIWRVNASAEDGITTVDSDLDDPDDLGEPEPDPYPDGDCDIVGHHYSAQWGEWTKTESGGYTISVILVCTRDSSHTANPTPEISLEYSTAPTCTKEGVLSYTATVELENDQGFSTSFEVSAPALGHEYGEPEWGWQLPTETDSSVTATATFTCTHEECTDETEGHTLVLTASSEDGTVTTETTDHCDQDNTTTYSATIVWNGEEFTDTRSDTTLPPLGHDYDIAWLWDEKDDGNGYTVTAIFECTRCGDEQRVVAENVTVDAAQRVEPTCEEEGTEVFTASVTFLDEVYESSRLDPIEATGHDLKRIEAVSATCVEDGNIAHYQCATCGKLFRDSEATAELNAEEVTVAAHGHNYDTVSPWSWETDGALYYATLTFYCSDCDETVEGHEHSITQVAFISMEEGEECIPATCTQSGSAVYVVEIEFNGKTYSDRLNVTLPPTGHEYGKPTWSWTLATEEDSTITAIATFACKNCDHTMQVIASSENETDNVIVETGRMTSSCTDNHIIYTATVLFEIDGLTYSNENNDTKLPPLGHIYAGEWEWAEDLSYATITITCDRNGDVHRTQKVESDYTISGVNTTYRVSYSFGGKVFTDERTVAKIDGEDAVEVPIQEATCTQIGVHMHFRTESEPYKYYYYDSVQNKFVEIEYEQLIISPLGHDFVESEWQWEGDLESGIKGTLVLECSRCGEKETITVKAVRASSGHTPAGCEEGGIDIYEATVVFKGQTYTGTTEVRTPPKGHSPIYVGETPATCDTVGYISFYQCERCEKMFSDPDCAPEHELTLEDVTLPLLSHQIVKVWDQAATCAQAGHVEHWECELCHRYFEDENGEVELAADQVLIPALPHTLIHYEAIPSTCTVHGVIEYWECTVCHQLFSDKDATAQITESDLEASLAPHDLTRIPTVNATCTSTGVTAHWVCSECGKLFSDAIGMRETTAEELVIEKAAHKWGSWTVTTPATTTTEGEREHECSVCHLVEKETIPVLTEENLVESFTAAVAAIKEAQTPSEKFTAINAALEAYALLSAEGRIMATNAYAELTSAITAYNTAAEKANGELISATEIAIRTLASSLSAISAMAAVWFVMKQGI